MKLQSLDKMVMNVAITDGNKHDTVNIHRGKVDLPSGFYVTDSELSRHKHLHVISGHQETARPRQVIPPTPVPPPEREPDPEPNDEPEAKTKITLDSKKKFNKRK